MRQVIDMIIRVRLVGKMFYRSCQKTIVNILQLTRVYPDLQESLTSLWIRVFQLESLRLSQVPIKLVTVKLTAIKLKCGHFLFACEAVDEVVPVPDQHITDNDDNCNNEDHQPGVEAPILPRSFNRWRLTFMAWILNTHRSCVFMQPEFCLAQLFYITMA